MNIPPEHAKECAHFPAPLQELVRAELALGNTIVELGHGFPAAPCGAYLKLARPVSSRPRAKSTDLDYYDRNTGSYSGEFTDAKRHFFVLEPPHPAEPEPDMNAIRAKLEADYAAANPMMPTPDAAAELRSHQARLDRANGIPPDEGPASILAQFRASMKVDYEKWHDGVGYDIALLKQASPEELVAIEELLLQRRCDDWRDVEALAVLGTTRAKAALKQAHATGSAEVRMAVHSHAPELLSDQQRVASLVQTLEKADIYGGLSQALDKVAEFHPPEIITALLRGLMERDGTAACHFAAMLLFIHGKAASAFDWDRRPFFLRFNTDDPSARETVVRELCKELGIDPHRCIKPKKLDQSP